MARITLCLIARDEAHFLAACLESVKGVVHEMIVVDTGSRDETVRIAEDLGAKVVRETWQDDFSRARNACLPHVTGDWVLVLDADERLAPGAGDVLQAAADAGGFDCAMLPLYDCRSLDQQPEDLASAPDAFKPPVYLHRLFRRDDALRWKNRIHESVVWLEDPARVVVRLDAPLVHYGNVPEIRARYHKDDRNFQLIEQTWNEDRDNLVMTAIYLSDRYRRAGNDEVKELAADTYARLAANFETDTPLRHPRFLNVVTIHMVFLMRDQAYEDALRVMERAETWGPAHPNLTWLGTTCLENLAYRQKDYDARTALLERALAGYLRLPEEHGKVFVSEVSPGLTSWLAALSIGRVYLRMGRPEDAETWFEKALEQVPADDQGLTARDHRTTAELGIIESMVDRGMYREAMRAVRRSGHIKTPDLHILRADIYERTDNFTACVDILQKVMSGDSLRPFLVASCEARLRELLSLVNLYKGRPMPGVGTVGTLCAVAKGRPLAELRDPVPLEEARLARALAYLHGTPHDVSFARFDEADTQAALPRLSALVTRLRAE